MKENSKSHDLLPYESAFAATYENTPCCTVIFLCCVSTSWNLPPHRGTESALIGAHLAPAFSQALLCF